MPFDFEPGHCKDFNSVLMDQGVEYTENPENKKFQAAQEKIGSVKNVLIQNIEVILERHEKIEVLVDATDQLKETSGVFLEGAKRIKQRACCKNVKMWICISVVSVIILAALLLVICKPNFS